MLILAEKHKYWLPKIIILCVAWCTLSWTVQGIDQRSTENYRSHRSWSSDQRSFAHVIGAVSLNRETEPFHERSHQPTKKTERYRTFEMTINSWYLRVVKETQVVFLVEGEELGITSDGRDDDDPSLLTLELFDWPRLHVFMVTAPQHLLYLLNLLRDEMIRLIYAQHGRHSIHRLWLQWNLSLHYYGHPTTLAYFRMILHCRN